MSTATASATPAAAAPAAYRRARAVRFLRTAHGWIGLWGAALGLLFGVSGILLNHRNVLKIPAAHTQEDTVQLALPAERPDNPKALAAWLQGELKLDREAGRVRAEPGREVIWGDQPVVQPARWTVGFVTPAASVQAEYWVGNGFVSVKRGSNNVFATLNNLHKGVGLGVGWVLLIDTLAGSILLLSLSGVALWTLTNRRRTVGAVIGGTSLLVALVIGASAF
ncbi:PepSY-associated TM helix domain-containing protein [Nevskia sp.]|uniref:PepSY-associated TM helix domain-containing protein n=1 Tax=Nevskia sp. TaxID=1929292 RepID=UPI0025EF3204|nr:PepSY-associated TM helix domain-containing protein [Nevskia sp.]